MAHAEYEPYRAIGADVTRAQDRLLEAEKGSKVSIGAYVFMSLLKLVIGFLSNSKALMADGINNTTDIAASLAVYIGLRVAGKPADLDHRYGHYRAEALAMIVAACIMFAVGLDVLWKAIQAVIQKQTSAPNPISMWIALFSAAFMFGISIYNYRLGKRTQSQAVLAAAADNRSDAFVSIGAFAGILGAQFGAYWLDPFAAVLVGLVIIKTAYNIFRDAGHLLIDGFDVAHLHDIEQMILTVPGVRGIKDIKARNYGARIYVDVVIGVEPTLTVVEGHEIADQIEHTLCSDQTVDNVHIHVEPL